MRLDPSRLALPYLLIFPWAALGCSGGERGVSGPGPPGGGPTTATLDVTAEVDAQDHELAETFGWSRGIPGTEVFLLRHGTASWQSATTDENGAVRFPGLANGLFRTYATRPVPANEASAVGEPPRALGGGRSVRITSVGDLPHPIELLADHPNGLLISELNPSSPPPWEVGGTSYQGGMYFEVYNNSDEVVFLDGKLFGQTYFWGARDYASYPCASTESIRTDPAGLYTRQVIAFPGSGGEYPIGPGEIRLIANSAIDHRPVHPSLVDLSGSDFEIAPSGAADNPTVPNMINVGEEPWRLNASPLIIGRSTMFLADPVDVEALPILIRDDGGRGYVRVPAEAILDAVSFQYLSPDHDLERDFCFPMVHERFDRYEAVFREIGESAPPNSMTSYQRIFLRDEGGRAILQNTNTTAADFVLDLLTPGEIYR